jgi:small-conductance mechanosensitive channel
MSALGALTPLWLALAMAGMLWLLDRRMGSALAPLGRLGRRRLPEWAHKGLEAGLSVARAVLPVFVLQGVVWVLASFAGEVEAATTALALEVLGVGVLYRGARATVKALLEEELLQIASSRVARLERFLLRTIAVVSGFQVALRVLAWRALGEDVEALLWCGLLVTLTVAALRLATLKEEVLALLAEGDGGSLWDSFRANLERRYHVYLLATMALLALWAVGYENAALFLLVRGYALVALVSALVGLQRRGQHWLTARAASSADEERRQTWENLERALPLLSFTAGLGLSLALLGLWPYVQTVLDTPFLRTSSLELSLYRLLAAALSLGLFLGVSRVGRALLSDHFYPRVRLDVSVGHTINTILHYLLVVAGFAAALDSLGLDLSAALVFLTAFSVGIGFGLQDIARNFVSGFILLFGRSVRKGDWVQVEDEIGRVDELGGRMVRLVTVDNTEILLPASRMVEGKVTNLTYATPHIRISVPVGVHYKSDVRQVEQALLHAARRHRAVLRTPAPTALLNHFGESSIDFELLVWIDVRQIAPRRLRGELNFHIWDVLKEQHIEIPYPQRDLYLKPDAGLEALARALRGEPPAAPSPPSPPAPPLARLDSYLTRHDEAPHFQGEEALDHIVNALHSVGRSPNRAHAIARVARAFAHSHQEPLRALQRALDAHLAAAPPSSGDHPLDRL